LAPFAAIPPPNAARLPSPSRFGREPIVLDATETIVAPPLGSTKLLIPPPSCGARLPAIVDEVTDTLDVKPFRANASTPPP